MTKNLWSLAKSKKSCDNASRLHTTENIQNGCIDFKQLNYSPVLFFPCNIFSPGIEHINLGVLEVQISQPQDCLQDGIQIIH